MATLERIRRRSGLLIIVIGLAMLAFILTDLLGSGNSIFRGDATVVGRIDGRTVEYNEFSSLMRERESAIRQANPQQAAGITNKQVADAVWDELVREELMKEQYDDLGFTVTGDELYSRVLQNPTIRQAPIFQDESGNFNEMRFRQYLDNLEGSRDMDPQAAEQYEQWLNFERSIKQNTLQTKYNTAVSKGIYMPVALAKQNYNARNMAVSGQFLALEYFSIADSSIEISDADLKDYYNENKERFKSEKSASIQYVNFPVAPAASDRNEVRDELSSYLTEKVVDGDTLENFVNSEEDSLFAVNYSDLRVGGLYYRADGLPDGLDSSIFEQEIGYIKGPYISNNFYRLSKLVDKKTFPDSVKARHILLSFQGIQNSQASRSFEEAKSMADSLVEVLRNDSSQFASIARELSDDPTSGAKGGDLGWFDERTMVRPFTDYSFNHEPGDVGLVMSQFGYHIIQVLDKAGQEEAVKIISISREIVASEETRDSIYNVASAFAASVNDPQSFSKMAEEKGFTPRQVSSLKEFDENISGLGTNREMVKWAHDEETEVGDIELFQDVTDYYAVAILTAATEDGYQTFESVKAAIRPSVLQDKKAEQLMAKAEAAISGKDDLQAIANELQVAVQDINTNFTGNILGQYGNEPAVVGVMTGIKTGKISEPIKGRRAVYVVQVNNRTPAVELPDYSNQQQQAVQSLRAGVQGPLYRSIKDNAKIEDRRAKFY